jgi:hypothetical protein
MPRLLRPLTTGEPLERDALLKRLLPFALEGNYSSYGAIVPYAVAFAPKRVDPRERAWLWEFVGRVAATTEVERVPNALRPAYVQALASARGHVLGEILGGQHGYDATLDLLRVLMAVHGDKRNAATIRQVVNGDVTCRECVETHGRGA